MGFSTPNLAWGYSNHGDSGSLLTFVKTKANLSLGLQVRNVASWPGLVGGPPGAMSPYSA